MNVVALGLLGMAAVAGAVSAWRTDLRAARLVMVTVWWLATAYLITRFVALDLGLAEVAAYSRAELPSWLRGAGAWAGPSGSLLLWMTLMVTAVVLASPRGGPATRDRPAAQERQSRPGPDWVGRDLAARLAGLVSVVGAIVLAVFANPFRLATAVPVNGRGLSPVLEHPAMLIHPPLLYLAQASVIFAALWATLGANNGRRQWPGRAPVAGAAALLVLATLIGAWWAHDELGWGGWWAWDPVENTALAPLAALIASLHASSVVARRRWVQAAAGLVLLGVAAARSGLASSVHAFASNAGPAVFIGLAGVAVLGLTLRAVLSDTETGVANRARGHGSTPGFEHEVAPGDLARRQVGMIVGAAAMWVVMVVVTGELAAMSLGAGWLGAGPSGANAGRVALDGGLVGRLMIPAGMTLLVGLMAYGWRAPRRVGMVLAHVGVVVFAVGVIASLGDWREFAVVPVDGQTELRGERVRVGSPRVSDDRLDLQRVEVTVTLGGSTYRPRIDRYPDLDRTRARPSRTLDWRGETEVVAAYIDDDRVGLEVRRHPGLGQVWAGGLLAATGLAVTAATALRRRRTEGDGPNDGEQPGISALTRRARTPLVSGRRGSTAQPSSEL